MGGAPSAGVFASVGVTTYLPVVVHPTPAGAVRIWRGSAAWMRLQ